MNLNSDLEEMKYYPKLCQEEKDLKKWKEKPKDQELVPNVKSKNKEKSKPDNKSSKLKPNF